MARPRNTQQRTAVERAAWQLFLTQGYEATSYAAIAEACQITKELVRHYAPTKEGLAVGLKQEVLRAAEQAVKCSPIAGENSYQYMYAVGCVAFEFFLATPGTRRFLMDVIANRELTESVVAFNASWALEQMRQVDGEQSRKAVRAVVMQLNGFAGLLYHCLRRDEPFDVEEEFCEVLQALGRATGAPGALDGYPRAMDAFKAQVSQLVPELRSAVTLVCTDAPEPERNR